MLYIVVATRAIYVMKLSAKQAESLVSLFHEGCELGKKVCDILLEIEATKAWKYLKDRFPVRATEDDESKSLDRKILNDAVAAVEYAEDAALLFSEVADKRKMRIAGENQRLLNNIHTLSLRLYRNMWELSLEKKDRDNVRNLILQVATVSVWEDQPSEKFTYEQVASAVFNGVVAFNHCFGITFISYKAGKVNGTSWSVPFNILEEAVLVARKDFTVAVSLLTI